ncbi:MAG: LysR family transcriptional regulator [Acidimicrobiales bacterium]
MDLRRLEHFLAVADHQGFTAAARVVGVSQPALSLSVKELEAEVDTALFHRLGRRVVLTPAGDALVGPARQALRDVATGRSAVAAVAGLKGGSLAIASLPTLAADPVAPLVGRFRREHPAVAVDLAAPEDSADLAAMVRDGRRELGITEDDGSALDLVVHGIGLQQLWLIAPPGTVPPGSGRWSGALGDLADLPFVAAPAGTSSRRLLEAGFPTGSGPNVAVVSAQRDALVPLVLSGAGAALVPEGTAKVARGQGALVVRPDPPVTRSIVLVHPRGTLAPAAARFVGLARDIA